MMELIFFAENFGYKLLIAKILYILLLERSYSEVYIYL